jgi:hypothetical protein
VVDSLTQAFTPQKATSPPIEGQIAELINNMLVGGLSAEMVKDRVEKHPPPENCENLFWICCREKVGQWIWPSMQSKQPCYKEQLL